MQDNIVKLVKEMHEKFNIDSEKVKFSDEEKKFRICAMQEELDEYKEATSKEDELDALIDLVVFTLGTAERQGFLEVFEEAFYRVMIANCKKEIGTNQKRGSFRLDLVKPIGWEPPCLSDLVEDKKYDLGVTSKEFIKGLENLLKMLKSNKIEI